MSTTQATHDRTDDLIEFLRVYYSDEVQRLAQKYPTEQQSLEISWRDLFQFDIDTAENLLDRPSEFLGRDGDLHAALRNFDLPADVSLANAYVRPGDLPEEYVYFPGEFSPTDEAGVYRGIKGEVSRATDVYSKLVEAAFECQRCGTMTYIPQTDTGFEEPHECQGCERQGPFRVNNNQSEFIDAQKFRIQTPPEIAAGNGQEIDVFAEDDLADEVSPGDSVVVHGKLNREQVTKGNEKTGKFEPYLDAQQIAVRETDHTDLEITQEERERIHAVADGAEGDPLGVAAQSLAPKIHGYEQVKKMCVLAMVGGSRVEYPTGDFDRGEFHILLLGDPGTAKSKLLDRMEDLGFRTVGVSGRGATVAGVTATAAKDDFSDAGQWTLDPGAFVKANGGSVLIDELDDMPEEVRSAMLEPMSKQSIHINKGGINTSLTTRTAVIAGGNPKYGRFDEYEPVHQQIDLGSTLLSRFDILYTLFDRPDPDEDQEISDHILDSRDAAKRWQQGGELDDDEEDAIQPLVGEDILRKWIALAKQQPQPTFASTAVKEQLRDKFVALRGAHGYDEDSPVPVTFRKLEGTVRVAEAAAKFEFSEVITERHVKIATRAVGQSIQDFGTDEDGKMDADVQETGESMNQREQKRAIGEIIEEMAEADGDGKGADREAVIDTAAEDLNLTVGRVGTLLEKMQFEDGAITRPRNDRVKFMGWF